MKKQKFVSLAAVTFMVLSLFMQPGGLYAEEKEDPPAVVETQPVEEPAPELSERSADSLPVADVAEDVVAIVESAQGSKNYTSLEDALAHCDASSTLYLKQDVTLTESIKLSGNLHFEGEGHTITVNLPATQESLFTNDFLPIIRFNNVTVQSHPDSQARFMSMSMGDIKLSQVTFKGFYTSGSGGVLSLDQSRGVEIDHCTFEDNSASSGGVIYASGSRLIIDNSTFTGNTAALDGGAIDAINSELDLYQCTFTGNSAKTGGAIKLPYDKSGSSTIHAQNSTFDSNQSTVSYKDNKNDTVKAGGALSFGENTDATLEQNTFVNNAAPEASGGAISVLARGNILFENNTITNGRASWGGGIFLYNLAGMDSCVFRGNTIQNCRVLNRGGGMRLANMQTVSGDITIESGVIENCYAESWGGGIDYTGHDQKPLRLKNAIITENTAMFGAGVWLCPTSQFMNYSTLGGAIYNNHANTASFSYGDDIQYLGKDWRIYLGPGDKSKSIVTVNPRALGGGKMKWYQDFDDEARYKAGDPEADPSLYTNVSNSFGLHGQLDPSLADLANAQGRFILRNNTAGENGGAIAANSPVIIGEDEDLSVQVQKVWKGTKTLPEQTTVTLYRVDATGEEVALDTGLILNAENEWKTTFDHLPSAYLDETGTKQSYTYTVKEDGVDTEGNVTIDGTRYKSTMSGNMQDGFTITNEKITPSIPLTPATKNLKVVKVWEDTDAKEAPEVTVALVKNEKVTDQTLTLNQENNWTATFENLPSIDPDKIESAKPDDANTYRVVEVGEKDGKVALNDVEYNVSYAQEKNTITITNQKVSPVTPPTPAYSNLKIVKEWEGIEADKAPEIQVKLMQDEKETDQALTLNAENQWTDTFEKLENMDADKVSSPDSKDIHTYTVKEIGEQNGRITLDHVEYEVTYRKQGNVITIQNKKTNTQSVNSKEDSKQKSETKENKTKTGANMSGLVWLCLGNVVMILFIVLLYRYKHMQNQ